MFSFIFVMTYILACNYHLIYPQTTTVCSVRIICYENGELKVYHMRDITYRANNFIYWNMLTVKKETYSFLQLLEYWSATRSFKQVLYLNQYLTNNIPHTRATIYWWPKLFLLAKTNRDLVCLFDGSTYIKFSLKNQHFVRRYCGTTRAMHL